MRVVLHVLKFRICRGAELVVLIQLLYIIVIREFSVPNTTDTWSRNAMPPEEWPPLFGEHVYSV
jgi:hypothetical protein